MIRVVLLVLLVASGIVLCGCGEGPASGAWAPSRRYDAESIPPTTPSQDAPYRVVRVERGGAIAGTCRLLGEATPRRLRPWSGMGSEEGRDDESVAVGEGRALGGCVVTIDSIVEGKDWPAVTGEPPRVLVVTVEAGRYEPHLALVRAPVQLGFVSRIEAEINVHGYDARSGATAFNLMVEGGTSVRDAGDAYLERPGVYRVTDDARGHFTAWIHVLGHPYAEVTRAEAVDGRAAGEFLLEEVPEGDRDVVCWHEPMDRSERLLRDEFAGYGLGPPVEIRRRVRVAAGKTTRVDFEIPATPWPQAPRGRWSPSRAPTSR